jgi:hypothetical protein
VRDSPRAGVDSSVWRGVVPRSDFPYETARGEPCRRGKPPGSTYPMNNDFFAILPEQYTYIADSPERSLARAVLQRAWDDLRDPKMLQSRGSRARARIRREAQECSSARRTAIASRL